MSNIVAPDFTALVDKTALPPAITVNGIVFNVSNAAVAGVTSFNGGPSGAASGIIAFNGGVLTVTFPVPQTHVSFLLIVEEELPFTVATNTGVQKVVKPDLFFTDDRTDYPAAIVTVSTGRPFTVLAVRTSKAGLGFFVANMLAQSCETNPKKVNNVGRGSQRSSGSIWGKLKSP